MICALRCEAITDALQNSYAELPHDQGFFQFRRSNRNVEILKEPASKGFRKTPEKIANSPSANGTAAELRGKAFDEFDRS